jgi:phosphatidate cytidylyltransferase
VNSDRKNLLIRIVSAAVGLPVVGAVVFWRDWRGLAGLCFLAALLGLVEYGRIALRDRPPAERAGLVLIGLGLYVGLVLDREHAFAWAAAAFLATSLMVLSRVSEISGAANRLAASVFGVFYVGGLLSALPLLHRCPSAGSGWVALAIAVTFANDTGAYFAGRAFGRHKLAPAISPGKTVEGAVGGAVAALIVTLAAWAYFLPTLRLRDSLVIGVFASVVGPAGDLVESLLKRTAGVKDSGRSIPGHGGVLDRIDALLFVSAYVYLYATLLR